MAAYEERKEDFAELGVSLYAASSQSLEHAQKVVAGGVTYPVAYGLSRKIERGYSISAAILDPDDPRKVIRRARRPIYIPSAAYELYGDHEYPVDVPAVVFPVGAFALQDKLLIYAGAGDKYIILLSCELEKLVDYLWEHGEL